jgi:hypothetical protein
MGCGVPVVTSSTPWTDNAQLEFVDHGRNGFIANHPRPFAGAVADLLTDDARRAAFAEEAVRTSAATDLVPLTRRLENLYDELLGGPPSAAGWTPGPDELDAFSADYRRRLREEFAPLTPRERVEMRLVREAEHCREISRHVKARTGAALRERGISLRRAAIGAGPPWTTPSGRSSQARSEADSNPASSPAVSRKPDHSPAARRADTTGAADRGRTS